MLHPSPLIDWRDDGLPDLAGLAGRSGTFDVVMLTAVWMHLDAAERHRAMPRLAALLRAGGGVMALSLRHGPVPPGRRMFDVSAPRRSTSPGARPALHPVPDGRGCASSAVPA